MHIFHRQKRGVVASERQSSSEFRGIKDVGDRLDQRICPDTVNILDLIEIIVGYRVVCLIEAYCALIVLRGDWLASCFY